MMASDVGIDRLQPCLLFSLLQGWVKSPFIGSLAFMFTHQPTGQPMVEVPKGPYHPGLQDPHLLHVYQYGLDNGLIKQAQDPRV